MSKMSVLDARKVIERNGGRINSYSKRVVHATPGIKVLGAIDRYCKATKFRWVKSES